MMINLSTLTMTEIIRLQSQLQEELTSRFERPLALLFSDIVGSTAYCARFGNATGRQLQQLHFDLLGQCVSASGGRVVDTAGDGAFVVFPSATSGLEGVVGFQRAMARANDTRGRHHQLQVRMGLHWGPVLTDGVAVSGDAVNLCSRLTASAMPGEVRLTRATFHELEREHRLNCRSLGEVNLPGYTAPVELLAIEWRDQTLFPRSLRIEETGETITLPRQDIVTFGRLLEHDGIRANDVVLAHPDPEQQRRISRWHFELRRSEHGMNLLALSDSPTTVDGARVERHASVAVRAGSRIVVGDVLHIVLDGMQRGASEIDASSTMLSSVLRQAADTPHPGPTQHG